ncbi:hypothetical protein EG329_001434 [Mollisiaceae sp. DMI_Dod_QoI]|nr:hypothetical protein EG329_001434 [Helotiales sp. DMI_Dod_QoI]
MGDDDCQAGCKSAESCVCGDGYTDHDGNWVNGDQARAEKAALAEGKGEAVEIGEEAKVEGKGEVEAKAEAGVEA